MEFDYYYPRESEQYAFIRIPKAFLSDDLFKALSIGAMLLYGYMLDRMALSRKNGWIDDADRVYIYCTIHDIREDLQCSKETAIKWRKELANTGLIEVVRSGQGRPDKIYIKNFTRPLSGISLTESQMPSGQTFPLQEDEEPDFEKIGYHAFRDAETELPEVKKLNLQKSKNQHSIGSEDGIIEIQTPNFKRSKEPTSRSPENRHQEVGNSDIKKSENQTSRGRKNRHQEVGNSDFKTSGKPTSIGRENRLLDFGNSDPNKTESSKTERIKDPSFVPSSLELDTREAGPDGRDGWRDFFREQIEYEALCIDCGEELVKPLSELAVEILSANKTQYTIEGAAIPAGKVKERLLQIGQFEMQQIIGAMQNNTAQIKNMKKYLLTALYNVPLTMPYTVMTDVNHVRKGGGTP
jgi:hypothetical protein